MKYLCLFFSALATLNCGGSKSDSPSNQSSAPTPEVPTEIEKSSKVSPSFDKNGLGVYQVDVNAENLLQGPSSSPAIQSSVLAVPAGSLSINTSLSIEQGADLLDQGIIGDLGLKKSQVGDERAPALVVLAQSPVEIRSPMSLSIDLPSQTQLTDLETWQVLYKIVVGKTYESGVLDSTAWKIENGKALIPIRQFGLYQLVKNPTALPTQKSQAQAAAIFNIHSERVADGDGLGQTLVSLRPVPKLFRVPDDSKYRHFVNAQTAKAFPLRGRCTENGSVVRYSGVVQGEAPCTDYQWQKVANLSQAAEGELKILLEHSSPTDKTDREEFLIWKDTLPPTASAEQQNPGEPTTGELFFNVAGANDYRKLEVESPGLLTLTEKTTNWREEGSLIFDFLVNKSGTYRFVVEFFDLAENKAEVDVTLNINDVGLIPPPPIVTGVVASAPPGANKIGLSMQTAVSTEAHSFLVVRRVGEAVSWTPSPGNSYSPNTDVDANHTIAGIFNHYGAGEDIGLATGREYHYAVFSFNASLEYSDPATTSASLATLTKSQIGSFGGPVSSVAVTTVSSQDLLLVSRDLRGLQVYDITGALGTSPALLAKVKFPEATVNQVRIAGSQAYVSLEGTEFGDGYGGVVILNLSTPASPTITATYPGTTNNSNYSELLVYDAQTILAWDKQEMQLDVISVATPSSPTRVTSMTAFSHLRGMALYGSLVVTADSDSLDIWDLSSQASPVRTGTLPRTDVGGSFAFNGTTAYNVTSGATNLCVYPYDFTDTSTPVLIAGSIRCNVGTGSANRFGNAIVPIGAYYAIASGASGIGDMWLINDDLTEAGSSNNNVADIQGEGRDLAMRGDILYVAADEAGVKIFDTTTASSNSTDFTSGPDGSIVNISEIIDVTVEGNTVVAANGARGVQILDVTTPAEPSWVAEIETSGFVSHLAMGNSTLWSAAGASGVRRYDLTDRVNPAQTHSTTTMNNPTHITIAGDNLLISNGGNGLYIQAKSTLADVGSVLGVNANLSVYDSARQTAYVSSGTNDIVAINLSNPASPTITKTITLPEEILSLGYQASSQRLLVATSQFIISSGFSRAEAIVLNMNDIQNPIETHRIKLSEGSSNGSGSIKQRQNDFFIPQGTGCYIINMDDPSQPYLSTVLAAEYAARGIAFDDSGNAYIADYKAGVTVHTLD